MSTKTLLVDPTNHALDSAVGSAPETLHLSPVKLRPLGLHTPAMLDAVCAADDSKEYVVQGLISRGSLSLAAGDSGVGKSPLFYQLGLCVAAGLRWLDVPTVKGPVIYIDLENGEHQSQKIRDDLVGFLGLEKCPENFLCHYGGHGLNVLHVIAETRPSLVVIDTLRAYNPEFEKDNTQAGRGLKELRSNAHDFGTAFLFIHHLRKPGENGVPALEDTPANQWLTQACGARALVNQTDFRLGIDSSEGFGRLALKKKHPNTAEDAAIVLRGHRRVRGEFGPIFLTRCFDDEGNPIGYRKMSGVELLCNADQERAYELLPPTCSFKEAKSTYGRGPQATSDWLEKCMRVGILSKRSKGIYQKRNPNVPEE